MVDEPLLACQRQRDDPRLHFVGANRRPAEGNQVMLWTVTIVVRFSLRAHTPYIKLPHSSHGAGLNHLAALRHTSICDGFLLQRFAHAAKRSCFDFDLRAEFPSAR